MLKVVIGFYKPITFLKGGIMNKKRLFDLEDIVKLSLSEIEYLNLNYMQEKRLNEGFKADKKVYGQEEQEGLYNESLLLAQLEGRASIRTMK